jgi:steroid 5-alpha reductase family enzyme
VSGFPWAAFSTNLVFAAAAAFAVMLTFFVLGTLRGMHRLVDVAWGLAFTAVAVVTYVSSDGHGEDTRRLLVTLATALWGVRLAAHIARRGRGHGEDPRYERMLAKAPGNPTLYALRTVYLLQGALVWIVSLPVQAAQFTPAPAGPLMFAGVAVWATGLFFEGVGDCQLARFKADPANRGRVMDRGLWSWTRHPNYFGDFLVWWGLFLMACGTWQAAVVSLASPLLMSVLLIKGSGKRLLESHMAQRPGYAEYMARTSGFFPRPPRSAGRGERSTR